MTTLYLNVDLALLCLKVAQQRVAIIVALCFSFGTACADKAIDQAIADLGSDRPEVRDEAESKIIASGDAALEDCQKALESVTDPEAGARLKRIVTTLELSKKLGALWKDRWFRVTTGNVYIGWVHETAEPAEVAGRPGWVFHSETAQTEDGDLIRFVSDIRCVSDSVLSPVSGRYVLAALGNTLDVKLTFGVDKLDLEVVTVDGEWAHGQVDEPSLRWRGGKYGVEENSIRLVEWASAEGADDLDVRLCTYMRSKIPMLLRFAPSFVAEETISVAGQDVRTRHYRCEANEESIGADYWIAEDGLVRADLNEGFGVTMAVDILRTDEEGAKKATGK